MLRYSVGLIFVVMLLIDGTSYARSTTSTYGRSFHKFYSGVVKSISGEGIVLNNKQYTYAPNVRVRAHEQNKGAFREVAANKYEIREGAHVIIKVEGSTIYEIIIERWKK